MHGVSLVGGAEGRGKENWEKWVEVGEGKPINCLPIYARTIS